jgi:DNA-binding beta-propeller fold protein YncE
MSRPIHFFKLTGVLFLALFLGGCVSPGQKDGLRLVRRIALPGVAAPRLDAGIPGRIDHMAYDPATRRLFVAALENGSLEVLDCETGSRVRSIGGLQKPQGIAILASSSRAVVACGGDGRLRVYDTRTLEEKATVEIGADADNARYDATNNTVLVAYGDTNGGAIAILDAATFAKQREIPFNSKPESFQIDPGGNFVMVNLPGGVRESRDGVVAVADRVGGAVEAVIALRDRARNFPMALDAAHQRVFIASRKPARLIEIDRRHFDVIAEAACIDDSDDLYYDAQTSRVLVIGGGFRPDLLAAGTASPASPPGQTGAIDVFSVGENGALARVGSTETAPHARTGLFVPSRRALYIAVPPRQGQAAEIREYAVSE